MSHAALDPSDFLGKVALRLGGMGTFYSELSRLEALKSILFLSIIVVVKWRVFK